MGSPTRSLPPTSTPLSLNPGHFLPRYGPNAAQIHHAQTTALAAQRNVRQYSMSELRKYCSDCKKTFATVGSYTRHLRMIHYKLKPLSCHVCHHAFYQRSDLKKHIQRQHPDEQQSPLALKWVSYTAVSKKTFLKLTSPKLQPNHFKTRKLPSVKNSDGNTSQREKPYSFLIKCVKSVKIIKFSFTTNYPNGTFPTARVQSLTFCKGIKCYFEIENDIFSLELMIMSWPYAQSLAALTFHRRH